MNKQNKIFTIAGVLLTHGVGVIAQTSYTAHGRPVHGQKKQAALICPVTGDKIASVQKAVGHSTFKGKTYYFCCAGCKPRFDKAPAKFVKNAARGKFEKM